MKDPDITTKVVHSTTKPAWNVVGTRLGGKYKIARLPYLVGNGEEIDEMNRLEAFEHAEFVAYCFNNSGNILQKKNEEIPPLPEVNQPHTTHR